MTTNTTTPTLQETRPPMHRTDQGITFGRVLRSEWIKVTTVPSTVILILATVIVMIGLAALSAWSFVVLARSDAQLPPDVQVPAEGPGSAAFLALTVPASGLIFGQLLLASLAVVLIASEWATGMIRSTLVAVPGRTRALLAKALVVAAIAFLVGFASALLSYVVAQPILGGADLTFSLTEDRVFLSIVNSGTYLALVALISLAIGILLRNTAGGIVTTVGLFFVLPVVVQLLTGLAGWVADAGRFLPGEAGQAMVAITTADGALPPLQGGLTMAAWALVLMTAALVVTRKRDV
ncbi:ABC transporter permease [Arthrobacter sp. Soc17.1.1.1]|uniref:ABC transporter permease n=1 Tax=Arthrobacter sp. Soc17.1.1.1 TaxID=3121277 RepID=UPI002FE43860